MSARTDPRKDLPTGTVTLLFADVEGSTRLLNLLGDRYLPVRARSRQLVREAASAHGGHEVDWAGDGVFLAFARAGDAVAAAVNLQRALAAEAWPPDGAVRLRMGIHTGEPELDAEGYVGIEVVVAARICAAAHGGQVVVSATTRELVGDEPVPHGSLLSLGTFRLKDIPEPEPLYQLAAPGLATSFPPLATLGGSTLPTLHHRLVGRREQVAAIEGLLARPDVRLVTITGVGGTGKSRLALEIASASSTERPVHLVGLAAISDADLVPGEIARTLGVADAPPEPLLARVAGALQGTRTLLYLDNLEHLPQAARHVRELLDAAPDLDVLVTSRAPLRLSGEHVLPLDPLSPDEAVELFVELAAARSLRIGPDLLPTIRKICVRVDCLPLAIEVVAARLAVLSAGQLLEALGSDFALDLEAASDLPERQRTLRATLDWSYDLLTPAQRALHGALAVFAGGCALEDARAVAGDPDRFLADLETLVLGSLVRGNAAEGEARLTLLETVREHALGRLATEGGLDELRERHAERFSGLAREGAEGLEGKEHAEWADRLERELDNIRASLDWMLASGRAADALLTMAALERFWRAHGHVTEARRWLAAGLQRGGDGVPADVRAAALWTAAQQATAQSDWAAAAPMLDEARDLYRAAGDGRAEVFALANASFVAMRLDDPQQAERLADEAVATAAGIDDARAASAAAIALADVHTTRGAHDLALVEFERAVELRATLGDPFLVCDAVYNLGLAAFHAGDAARARRAFEDALLQARDLDEAPYVAAAQLMLAILDVLEGEAEAAGPRVERSLEIYTSLEDDRSRARCLVVLAAVALSSGSPREAARLLGASRAAREPDDPDYFELPLLERVESELERELTASERAALEREGASLDLAEIAAIVTPSTRE
jgi:predicted ATPase/class 3 adenylate cyclase